MARQVANRLHDAIRTPGPQPGPAEQRFFPAALRPIILAVLWGLLPGLAGAQQPTEYEVEAAFLLNFTRFIEWPTSSFADARSPFAICIYGKDPFGAVLDEIVQGESVNGRRLTVKRLSEPSGFQSCQILFFSTFDRELLKNVSASGHGVLTVGEGDNFVRAGGVIGFVLESRRVRFDINQTAAEEASLKLSSKLLSVARSLHRIKGQPR